MGKINTFNPSDVLLSINDFVVKGFASGTFIEIVQNRPYFRVVPGIRGKATRVRNRDRSGVLNIRLMQTSSDNEVLSRIVEQDDINQTGRLTVTLRDVGGQTGIQFGDAFLEGPPNVSFSSQETQMREWRVHYQYITRFYVAGNEASPLNIL